MVLRVVLQFLRYDLVAAVRGFAGNYTDHREDGLSRRQPELERTVCRYVATVSSFYWKQVRCLQRSIVTARVLRAYGIAAEVVIGYRLAPPVSHAWVEIDGRVINDSAGYQQKFRVLHRF